MELVIKPDYQAMCQAVADRLIEIIAKKPACLLELPGGDTPRGIFDCLVDAAASGKVDVSQCSFVSLDEWEGLGYETKGSCRQTLFDELFYRLPIDVDRQVCFFDGRGDLAQECRRIDQFVFEHGGLDAAVLGVGMNGHVGFNEPGVDPEQYCTVVPLDSVTREVSIKYFNGEQLNIGHGITLGFKHLIDAREVMLIANSERKASIVQRIVEGPITNEVPASLMRRAARCTFYLDTAAASALDGRMSMGVKQ